MSKARDYIRENTKRCSNELEGYTDGITVYTDYRPWLTPENALAAVEIAKEEWLEEAINFFEDNYNSLVDGGVIGVFDNKEKMIEEFKEYIKGEQL